eukprot:152410-Amphidinium_carterae.1
MVDRERPSDRASSSGVGADRADYEERPEVDGGSRRYSHPRTEHPPDDDETATRRTRLRTADAETQASDEPWTGLDLKPSLMELSSGNKVVRSRALRRIHVRLWHCGAEKMKRLLSLAGAPRKTLDEVDDIIDTCAVCREWTRRSDHPVHTSSITTSFNE